MFVLMNIPIVSLHEKWLSVTLGKPGILAE
jgi:hypothetical protein